MQLPDTFDQPSAVSSSEFTCGGEDPATHTEPEPMSVFGDLATGDDPPTHTEPEPLSICGDLATGEDLATHTEPEPMSVFGDLATGENPPTHTEPKAKNQTKNAMVTVFLNVHHYSLTLQSTIQDVRVFISDCGKRTPIQIHVPVTLMVQNTPLAIRVCM